MLSKEQEAIVKAYNFVVKEHKLTFYQQLRLALDWHNILEEERKDLSKVIIKRGIELIKEEDV
jgi:hypothetical protein